MYTDIAFLPLIKYLAIFIISYMFLNYMKFGQQQVIVSLCFILILSITVDIFQFAEYEKLIDIIDDDVDEE
jgi:uncharacterized membrane-anchored protein YitT (DUF2179 family)